MERTVVNGDLITDLLAGFQLDSSVAVPSSLLVLGLVLFLIVLLICLCRRQYVMLSPVWLLALAAPAGLWVYEQQTLQEQKAAFVNWRAQGTAVPSVLSCLGYSLDVSLKARCESALFSRAENVAAATTYLNEGLTLLAEAKQLKRTNANEREISRLRTLLERDPFGLVAHILVAEGCTQKECARMALLDNPATVLDNMARGRYQTLLAQHLDANLRGQEAALPIERVSERTGGLALAPVPEKYTLPSSRSIPPVEIMEDEPRPSSVSPARAASAPPVASDTAKQGPRSKPPADPVELKPMILTR
jgi:hypothetical protein